MSRDGHMACEPTPEQGQGIVRQALPAALMLVCLILGIYSGWVAERLLLAGALCALAVGVGFWHLRYRPVTTQERAMILETGLVHLTGAQLEPDRGEVFLDPRRCRIRSIALRASWPFVQRATYAFVGEPAQGAIRYNIDRSPSWTVRFIPDPGAEILIRRGAVALPQGYRGPAVIEPVARRARD